MSLQSIKAQAHIHHAYLLGLQLMISSRKGPEVMEEWMFRLFRRQHNEKFLSSFDKLGLSSEPDAVACAKYHVLSNGIGGVPVEYMADTDTKAWVRFRYPRWMYHGPTICGIPVGVSRGFLRGWYAQNGVSLGNPRLGFVCVSEDMTGEFGLCGYFREYDYDLSEGERLQFARSEKPPSFNGEDQPSLPARIWSSERVEKANRNYALDYIRNGLPELATVIGDEETIELGSLAARLIGLQYYAETCEMVGGVDGDIRDAYDYLSGMMAGMGDELSLLSDETDRGYQHQSGRLIFEQRAPRIVRGMSMQDRELLMTCWCELWSGAIRSQRLMMVLARRPLENNSPDDSRIIWELSVDPVS